MEGRYEDLIARKKGVADAVLADLREKALTSADTGEATAMNSATGRAKQHVETRRRAGAPLPVEPQHTSHTNAREQATWFVGGLVALGAYLSMIRSRALGPGY